MPSATDASAAEAVQEEQQRDAEELFERLQQLAVGDLTINYTLEQSSVVLPGVLVRFLTVAVLFRLNSAKKWRLALDQGLLPEPVREWLGVEDLTDLIDQATVDWISPRVFADVLSWRVVECLTQCGMPQPIAVVRQTIRDLLLCDA